MSGEGADIRREISLATTLAESEDTNSNCAGRFFPPELEPFETLQTITTGNRTEGLKYLNAVPTWPHMPQDRRIWQVY